jgi:hypothetical protein
VTTTLDIAAVVLAIAAGYMALGMLVGLGLSVRGLDRIDPAAHGMSWHTRIVLFPGLAALWPIMLSQAIRQRKQAPSR